MVTGSRGFVGRATDRILGHGYGHTVLNFDILDGNDIRVKEDVEHFVLVQKPDRILHLAAIARFDEADLDPLRAHSTNVVGTANIVAAAERHHVPVVYASTGSVYMPVTLEPPITEDFPTAGNSVYAVTKMLGEELVMAGSMPWIILRYAHLYGPEKRYHGLFGNLISRMERGLSPQLFGGGQSNDFTYIDDVARANRLALEAEFDAWNHAYNIGTGEEISASVALKVAMKAFGSTADIEYLDSRSVDASRFVYDVSKAARGLGFTAEFGLAEGLVDFAKKAELL